ncbi:hypothetical protein B0H14DRAFT_2582809 [Mycena olivaceomarginata]|nr:hypothetical protein B0H14DRAFT_2582809 [Mycena olivaceomarginata]
MAAYPLVIRGIICSTPVLPAINQGDCKSRQLGSSSLGLEDQDRARLALYVNLWLGQNPHVVVVSPAGAPATWRRELRGEGRFSPESHSSCGPLTLFEHGWAVNILESHLQDSKSTMLDSEKFTLKCPAFLKKNWPNNLDTVYVMPSRREGGEGIQLSDAWHVFSIREEEPMILIPVYPSGGVLSDNYIFDIEEEELDGDLPTEQSLHLFVALYDVRQIITPQDHQGGDVKPKGTRAAGKKIGPKIQAE